MLSKFLRNPRGVTIVELILVIAVLGVVMAAALSFFLFGTRTFTLGANQARVQQEARLATTMIGQDLRTSVDLRVYDGTTPSLDSNDHMISRSGAGPYSLVYKRPGTADLSTDDVFTDLYFTVTYDDILANNGSADPKKYDDDKLYITLNAVGNENGRTYTIENRMLLENSKMHTALNHASIVSTDKWTAIIFDK